MTHAQTDIGALEIQELAIMMYDKARLGQAFIIMHTYMLY